MELLKVKSTSPLVKKEFILNINNEYIRLRVNNATFSKMGRQAIANFYNKSYGFVITKLKDK